MKKSYFALGTLFLSIIAIAQPATKRYYVGGATSNFKDNNIWSTTSGGTPVVYVADLATEYIFDGGNSYTINLNDTTTGFFNVKNNSTVKLQSNLTASKTDTITGLNIEVGSKLILDQNGSAGAITFSYSANPAISYKDGIIDGELQLTAFTSGTQKVNLGMNTIKGGFTHKVSSTGVIKLLGNATSLGGGASISSTLTSLDVADGGTILIDENASILGMQATMHPNSNIRIEGNNQTTFPSAKLSSTLVCGNIFIDVPANTVKFPIFGGMGWTIKGNLTINRTAVGPNINGMLAVTSSGSSTLVATIEKNLVLSNSLASTNGITKLLYNTSTSTNTNSTINILGNVEVNSGTTLDLGLNGAGAGQLLLNVKKDLIVNGTITETGGSLSPAGYPIALNGTTQQKIDFTDATILKSVSLTLNNPAGFQLLSNINWSNGDTAKFNFINGIVNNLLNGYTIKISNPSPTATNQGLPTSYLNGGEIVRAINIIDSVYGFAVGDNNRFRPVKIYPKNDMNNIFHARYFAQSHPQTAVTTTGDAVACCEYWDIYTDGLNPGCDISLITANDGHSSIINRPNVYVGHYNGTTWDRLPDNSGNAPYIVGGSSGSEISTFNYTGSFSPFTFIGPSGALAAEVNNFDIKKINNTASINWKTTCNSGEIKMIVEKSKDEISYNSIYNTVGDRVRCLLPFNYLDNTLFVGKNYYRLKIIDENNKITYSKAVIINNSNMGLEIINLIPNLISTKATLIIISDKSQLVNIVVSDLIGKVVMNKKINITNGTNEIVINAVNLPQSIYHISATGRESKTNIIRFIKAD